MLSKTTPTRIGPTPTAQSTYDALSVSDYMDHVVDNWITAYTQMQIQRALNEYINQSEAMFEGVETPEYRAAKAAFDAAYSEMLYRFNEYTA
jgi:hypothetical protein